MIRLSVVRSQVEIDREIFQTIALWQCPLRGILPIQLPLQLFLSECRKTLLLLPRKAPRSRNR